MKAKIKRNTQSTVPFPVLYETHDLKTFQAEGHFVPAIRLRDAEGNATRLPRAWKGAVVHALTLLDPITQTPHRTQGQSTARALSDSREDAERIFADQIREGFYGTLRALDVTAFNADQARRVKDERDRLVAWMVRNQEPRVLAEVLGIAESAVEEYKRAENDPALKAKVDAMLTGGL